MFIIRNMKADIKHKNCHISGPRASPGSEFDTKLHTMSPEALAHPKDPVLPKFCSFEEFQRSPKSA